MSTSWVWKYLEHMSQLLRVDPSALASSPPAIGWRPASRGRPGATRDRCDLYTFILWAGSTRCDREGGSCSVLYSNPLRAIGTPVPEEMRNGASHYGGSPLILLNKEFASGRQGARRATWTAAREWNETTGDGWTGNQTSVCERCLKSVQ